MRLFEGWDSGYHFFNVVGGRLGTPVFGQALRCLGAGCHGSGGTACHGGMEGRGLAGLGCRNGKVEAGWEVAQWNCNESSAYIYIYI